MKLPNGLSSRHLKRSTAKDALSAYAERLEILIDNNAEPEDTSVTFLRNTRLYQQNSAYPMWTLSGIIEEAGHTSEVIVYYDFSNGMTCYINKRSVRCHPLPGYINLKGINLVKTTKSNDIVYEPKK